jgi:asparagine synthetase B (glutamine-hydrolysing)
VLHITGTTDYYHQDHINFLAYNGEIYNYRELGAYANDVEFVHDCVENNLDQINLGWGPWAWAWTDGNQVLYATDPQGERSLYQYQDKEILIVSSEIAPILEYIQPVKQDLPYLNKLWTIIDRTPWQGIKRIEPGCLYQDGEPGRSLDNVWNWIKSPANLNMDEAYEQFRHVWQQTIKTMTPACGATLTYSGGLDSSIILSHMPNLELYSVNCIGKDPIVDRVHEFLTDAEQYHLHVLAVDPSEWAANMIDMIDRTRLPAQSWSHVGQWIIAQNCNQRVLFTGVGADELFGGYDLYQSLDYNPDQSASPYSKYGQSALWSRCLSAYQGDYRSATLLMDYWYQVAGCDVRGIDLIIGAHGIEPRNPFLAKPIMQLALNLPFKLRVGPNPKPLIRRLFLERWNINMVMPKKGFTGHANDALPYLPVQIDPTGDRMNDWKQISRKMFYDRP